MKSNIKRKYFEKVYVDREDINLSSTVKIYNTLFNNVQSNLIVKSFERTILNVAKHVKPASEDPRPPNKRKQKHHNEINNGIDLIANNSNTDNNKKNTKNDKSNESDDEDDIVQQYDKTTRQENDAFNVDVSEDDDFEKPRTHRLPRTAHTKSYMQRQQQKEDSNNIKRDNLRVAVSKKFNDCVDI